MTRTSIYALCEFFGPVPVIRYIGKTNDLKRRLRKHLTESVKHKSHLGNWLRVLKTRGETPHLMALCEVDAEIGSDAERLHIRLARDGGMDLVNSTEGGDGVIMTPEIRAKISTTKKGTTSSFLGHSHTPEAKALNSVSHTGTKMSLEVRAKMCLSQQARRAAERSVSNESRN